MITGLIVSTRCPVNTPMDEGMSEKTGEEALHYVNFAWLEYTMGK